MAGKVTREKVRDRAVSGRKCFCKFTTVLRLARRDRAPEPKNVLMRALYYVCLYLSDALHNRRNVVMFLITRTSGLLSIFEKYLYDIPRPDHMTRPPRNDRITMAILSRAFRKKHLGARKSAFFLHTRVQFYEKRRCFLVFWSSEGHDVICVL